MPSAIEKAMATYDAIAAKCRDNPGDKQSMSDKAKAFQEVRSLEREQARAGNDRTPSKKALQQEYINRFPEQIRAKVAKRVYGTK